MFQFAVAGVTALIAIAITLGIGTVILGATSTSIDCKTIEGYTAARAAGGGQPAVAESYTGYAKACLDAQNTTQSSYGLIIIVLILIGAAVILGALRLFSGGA